MWTLYDKLIEQVEGEHIAEEMIAGLNWTATKSKTVGLALSSSRPLKRSPLSGNCQGRTIPQLAELIKSWDPFETSVGLSAINSIINCHDTITKLENDGYLHATAKSGFSFISHKIAEKKVAVVGHFPRVEELSKHCQLTVLERSPQIGDLPDPACEYILPEQDYVFITSSTLINKTAPRLLELSKNAVTIMLGPSTPLSPVLFEMGVDVISGLIVENEEHILRCVKEGGGLHTFQQSVKLVNVYKNNLDL